MSVKSYRNFRFSSGPVAGEDYREFEEVCKKELKKKCVGFNLHSFNKNHYEWSAVLEKNGKYIYVSIEDVRFFDWYDCVLVRTMKHPTDWTGGSNNFVSWDNVPTMANTLIKYAF